MPLIIARDGDQSYKSDKPIDFQLSSNSSKCSIFPLDRPDFNDFELGEVNNFEVSNSITFFSLHNYPKKIFNYLVLITAAKK